MKYTTIILRDGYAASKGAPLVNNSGGYAAAATTMTIDGVTGAFANGDVFTMGVHDDEYTVTAHTETSLNTTSITFTPGLVDAVLNNEPIHLQTHSLEIRIGEGTLTFDEKRKIEYKLDRGRLFSVRQGDEEPMDIRFDFIWEFLTAVGSSGTPTIEDALKNRGEASDWISSDTDDPCAPYSVDIIVRYRPPCDGIDGENIVLPKFRWEGLNHDAKAGTVAVTGKCNTVESTSERVAA